MYSLNRFTKIMLIISLALIIYGYLCRIVGLYFFWDSKSFGYLLLVICAISYFVNKAKQKKSQGTKASLEKFVAGFLIFSLLLFALLITLISSSDVYKATKDLLQHDEALKQEIGNIRGFSLIPQGSVHQTSQGGTSWGNATLNITVKGEKKFKDLTVMVEKHPTTQWMIVKIED